MSSLESLESRRLFAGVTVITHGYDDNTTGWVSTMADAIAARAGGLPAVSIYTLQIGVNSSDQLAVLGFVHESDTSSITACSSGQTIIKLDWSTVSTGQFSTVAVGDVAAAWLMTSNGGLPALDELPIDLIGHSRGASLNCEIAKDLGQHDVWVDQFTSLDPHPVNGDLSLGDSTNFGDEPMETWSNIVFADDYWRTNGNPNSSDPNGEPVAGAFNQSLAASVEADFTGSAHDSVHAWYYGTINTTATNDGDGINIPSAWYGKTAALPARKATGFDFTLIGGGARPASGLAATHGGKAARVDPGEVGTQSPDIGDISLSSDIVKSGTSFKIHFTEQDPQSDSRVVYYLDTDQNPFNGNNVRVLADDTLVHATGVKGATVKAGTTGVKHGKYYVCAEIIGIDGLVRYEYSPQKVTID